MKNKLSFYKTHVCVLSQPLHNSAGGLSSCSSKVLFSILFLRSLEFVMKRICRNFPYVFVLNKPQWADNVCYMRKWLQWRVSCSREPSAKQSDPRPPNPAACWPWSWVGSTVCPKLLFSQGLEQSSSKSAELVSDAPLLGSRNESAHSLPFLHREHSHTESLFCAKPALAAKHILSHYFLSMDNKATFLFGAGVVKDYCSEWCNNLPKAHHRAGTEFELTSFDTNSRVLSTITHCLRA